VGQQGQVQLGRAAGHQQGQGRQEGLREGRQHFRQLVRSHAAGTAAHCVRRTYGDRNPKQGRDQRSRKPPSSACTTAWPSNGASISR
jgi:hypothetical protein